MNILLINPKFPDTFWSFKHALKFVSKRTAFPPLGLLTVASMPPHSWNKRLVDMNVQDLREIELRWADLIFLGGMSIQLKSARAVIERCKAMGKKIVAGGPLFTSFPDDFEDVNYLVLNEAELTLPQFLMDIKNHTARHCYRSINGQM